MFPIYNNLDFQLKIFAVEFFKINQQNKRGSKMQNIVKMPAPSEYPIYNSLNREQITLFEFAAKNCDRFVIFENANEISDYFKNISDKRIDFIKQSLREFKFCFVKIKLSEIAPEQKILFIYDRYPNAK